MNTAGHIFDSSDTLVGAYSDQPLDPTGRAAFLAKEPTDDHALTGGRWVVRPNSFGIRVWVPDEDHAQPTPGTCIDCGEPASTKRRLRCDPCRKEAHRRDKARHMRKVRSKAA